MNWMKYRPFYLVLSVFMIALSFYGIIRWSINLGVDFLGGAMIEYSFSEDVSTEDVSSSLNEEGFDVASVQVIGDGNILIRLAEVDTKSRERIKEILGELDGGEVVEVRYESVGPSIGPELIKKTVYAVIISAGGILIWVALQFRSLRFGVSAILAMFHDSFILVGSSSILGYFFGMEVDFLFVTALLTTLSFSVHDTIVVYDRIREIRRKRGGEFDDIANRAISETMRRSINNSVTIILMLLALVILGGTSTRWFALALLVGTVLGTYSSPFVAVPLLVTWGEVAEKFKRVYNKKV